MNRIQINEALKIFAAFGFPPPSSDAVQKFITARPQVNAILDEAAQVDAQLNVQQADLDAKIAALVQPVIDTPASQAQTGEQSQQQGPNSTDPNTAPQGPQS